MLFPPSSEAGIKAEYLKLEKAVVCRSEPRTEGGPAVQQKCYLQECSVQATLKSVGGQNLLHPNVFCHVACF